MPISAELLSILACPSADHAPLIVETAPAASSEGESFDGSEAVEELVCTVCRSRFPVRDGIPVLLADDARPGPNGLGVPG